MGHGRGAGIVASDGAARAGGWRVRRAAYVGLRVKSEHRESAVPLPVEPGGPLTLTLSHALSKEQCVVLCNLQLHCLCLPHPRDTDYFTVKLYPRRS